MLVTDIVLVCKHVAIIFIEKNKIYVARVSYSLDGVIYVSNFGSKEVNVQLVCKTLMNV